METRILSDARNPKIPVCTETREVGTGSSSAAVLQEALANAVIHADYYNEQGLSIQRTNGEIVISNPGSMRISGEEAIRKGTADPRNKMLVRMFALAGIGHGQGEGLHIMQNAWQQSQFQKPILIEQFKPDRTIVRLKRESGIWNGIATDRMELDEWESAKQKILDDLMDHITADLQDLSARLQITETQAQIVLHQLLQEDFIVEEVAEGKIMYRLKR